MFGILKAKKITKTFVVLLRKTRAFSSNSNYLKQHKTPKHFKPSDVCVFFEVISKQEEENLTKEIDSLFKYTKYDASHYDKVINHYREKQVLKFSMFTNQLVMERIYALLKRELKLNEFEIPHVIDLFPNTGVIDKHVDSVKYGGSTVSGLSLLSDRVMRLMDFPETDDSYVDVTIPRRSLYYLRNDARYKMSHAIPSNSDRRISIIFRDQGQVPKWMMMKSKEKKKQELLDYDEKINICKSCEFSREIINTVPTICNVCNCPIAFRAFMGAPCPKNKW